MAKTASCITTWRGCLKNSTVHASLLGMYHSATIQLLFFFDCAITSNVHILNPDMRQNCKVPLVCTHTHTLNQITLNWIRVDEHTRFKAIPIMELGRWSSYRKGEKSENLSVDLMTLVKTWWKLSSLSKRKAGMKQHGGSQTRQILRLEKDRTEWTQRTLHVICWRVTDPTTLAHMGDGKGDRVRLGDTRWPGAEWQARENMRCRITGIKEWSWRRRRKKRMKQRVLISYFHWAIKANTFFDV